MEVSKTATIMDIPFLNETKEGFLQNHLLPRLEKEQKTFVVTANPEIVMKTREDARYKTIVQSADYVIPDGTGIVLAAKFMNQPLVERVPGYELMLALLEQAEKNGWSCFFLGASEQVNEKAVAEAQLMFPELKIAGRQHGFFDMDDPSIADYIAASGADIVFVALGMPRQEKWIAQYTGKFSKGLFIGVGGSFDTLAGVVKRAPQKWIDWNLEWLYRVLQQPSRLRRIVKVFEFMLRIIFKKY
ncbi:MAG TPA: WecB/TagA/CpsF family glycosyltransferase [Virgibacillus sp.]|nr:WecB/TagA/CpsF family glycosyltransferase [Virgibacillus sp.]